MDKIEKFIKGAYGELKLVKWPSRQEIIRLTSYVIGASVLVGVLVAAVDFLLKGVLEMII